MQANQVQAAIELMKAGHAIPNIARHKKAATGGLTIGQLRQIELQWMKEKALTARKEAILAELANHPDIANLKPIILNAPNLFYLEDVYLPFRPHQKARPTVEVITPDLMHQLREKVWQEALLSVSAVHPSKKHRFKAEEGLCEPVHQLSAERAWRLFKGRKLSLLKLTLTLPAHFSFVEIGGEGWLEETFQKAFKAKIWPKLMAETFSRLREQAEEAALTAFRHHFRKELTKPPVKKVILGVEPLFRAGVKLAVIDQSGQCLDYSVVYPFLPECAKEEALAEIAKLMMRHHVEAISLAQGKSAEETQALLEILKTRYPDLACPLVSVNSNGATEYATSPAAEKELPDLDAKWRSTVSIARRLQNPLDEWKKMDPKAIGLGQDINPNRFAHCMQTVLEDCVSHGLPRGFAPRKDSSPSSRASAKQSSASPSSRSASPSLRASAKQSTSNKNSQEKTPLNNTMAAALAKWKEKSS